MCYLRRCWLAVCSLFLVLDLSQTPSSYILSDAVSEVHAGMQLW